MSAESVPLLEESPPPISGRKAKLYIALASFSQGIAGGTPLPGPLHKRRSCGRPHPNALPIPLFAIAPFLGYALDGALQRTHRAAPLLFVLGALRAALCVALYAVAFSWSATSALHFLAAVICFAESVLCDCVEIANSEATLRLPLYRVSGGAAGVAAAAWLSALLSEKAMILLCGVIAAMVAPLAFAAGEARRPLVPRGSLRHAFFALLKSLARSRTAILLVAAAAILFRPDLGHVLLARYAPPPSEVQLPFLTSARALACIAAAFAYTYCAVRPSALRRFFAIGAAAALLVSAAALFPRWTSRLRFCLFRETLESFAAQFFRFPLASVWLPSFPPNARATAIGLYCWFALGGQGAGVALSALIIWAMRAVTRDAVRLSLAALGQTVGALLSLIAARALFARTKPR